MNREIKYSKTFYGVTYGLSGVEWSYWLRSKFMDTNNCAMKWNGSKLENYPCSYDTRISVNFVI